MSKSKKIKNNLKIISVELALKSNADSNKIIDLAEKIHEFISKDL